MPVRDQDRGAKALLAKLHELEDGAQVTVGVHADDGTEIHRGSKSRQTVGQVAVEQEFRVRRGKGGRRHDSYLRRSVAYLKRQLIAELKTAAVDVLKGATVEHAFATPGRTLLERMQQAVAVDTGQVRETMHVRVRGRKVA
jgi:hypothetical protein